MCIAAQRIALGAQACVFWQAHPVEGIVMLRVHVCCVYTVGYTLLVGVG